MQDQEYLDHCIKADAEEAVFLVNTHNYQNYFL